MLRPLLALLLASAPAFASRPAESLEPKSSLEGLYAALGGGGGFVFQPGDNSLGYDVEGRIGYSFNPTLQLYLSGAVDGASFSGTTLRTEQIAAFLQYHLLVREPLMVYGRAGIGVGLSGDIVPGSTAAGLAAAGGIGVEIRVTPDVFVAPEVFYRSASLSTQGVERRIQTLGLQISLVYY
ncbi:MAG TPA: outer membrane beta-barrel protein [Myxococcales bacterium]|nr:outer membrane beta-barrel protein [Myxococcales bacterium]